MKEMIVTLVVQNKMKGIKERRRGIVSFGAASSDGLSFYTNITFSIFVDSRI